MLLWACTRQNRRVIAETFHLPLAVDLVAVGVGSLLWLHQRNRETVAADLAIGPRTAKDAKRAGLPIAVIADQQTVDALNISPAQRVAQLRVNLERLRWVAQDIGVESFLIFGLIAMGCLGLSVRWLMGVQRQLRAQEVAR